MNRPKVWKAFHDAFAVLPAEFLATVTMSSIYVHDGGVRLELVTVSGWDGQAWQVSHNVARWEFERSIVPVEDVARIAWEQVIQKFNQFPRPAGQPVPPDGGGR